MSDFNEFSKELQKLHSLGKTIGAEDPDPKEFVDQFYEIFNKYELVKPEEQNYIFQSNLNLVFEKIFFQKPLPHLKNKKIQDDLEYFRHKCFDLILLKNHTYARKEVFTLFLEHKKMKAEWDLLKKVSEIEAHNLIYESIKESGFLTKIKYRNIDLSLYFNKDRKQKPLNMLEHTLCLFLTVHYPSNIGIEKTFEHLYKSKVLEVDFDVIKNHIQPLLIKRNRLNKLPKEIRDGLNKNFYPFFIDKKNDVFFNLNTEDFHMLSLAIDNAESLFKYGYFYLQNGKKNSDDKEFLLEYCKPEYIQKIIPHFFLLKHSKAKSVRSKSFWLNLDLNLKMNFQVPEKIIKQKNQIKI